MKTKTTKNIICMQAHRIKKLGLEKEFDDLKKTIEAASRIDASIRENYEKTRKATVSSVRK